MAPNRARPRRTTSEPRLVVAARPTDWLQYPGSYNLLLLSSLLSIIRSIIREKSPPISYPLLLLNAHTCFSSISRVSANFLPKQIRTTASDPTSEIDILEGRIRDSCNGTFADESFPSKGHTRMAQRQLSVKSRLKGTEKWRIRLVLRVLFMQVATRLFSRLR